MIGRPVKVVGAWLHGIFSRDFDEHFPSLNVFLRHTTDGCDVRLQGEIVANEILCQASPTKIAEQFCIFRQSITNVQLIKT